MPYTQVNAVSFVSDKSMFGKFATSSTIALSAGGQTYEVRFRGDEKARHVHDAVLARMLGVRLNDCPCVSAFHPARWRGVRGVGLTKAPVVAEALQGPGPHAPPHRDGFG